MCDALPTLVPRLDVIINNACQTVRRPPQYYLPLIAAEREAKSADGPQVARLTAAHRTVVAAVAAAALPAAAAITAAAAINAAATIATSAASPAAAATSTAATTTATATFGGTLQPAETASEIVTGMSLELGGGVPHEARSALMSLVPLAPGDDKADDAAFPVGRRDANTDLGQQLDLRQTNSWTLKLEQVSTAEMAEVLAINSLAPAILNGRLRAFIEASGPLPGQPAGAPPPLKFIVNVSAMEGRFYKWKAPTHPHTNMAKAALNMMTRTSAADYAKSGIYMTAVDTGWINDEKPAERAAADANTHNFQTPIDEVDAAARVLDPIIAPLRRLAAGEKADPPFGCFLKDYGKCEW